MGHPPLFLELCAKIAALDPSAAWFLVTTDLTRNTMEVFHRGGCGDGWADALSGALTWCETPQGHDFWYELYFKLENEEE